MKCIADLHVHSKYSRATSGSMDLEGMASWAKLKGIDVVGTGDFTHPLWLKELEEKLTPLRNGLFAYGGVTFMLTTEVSNVYEENGKVRKVHQCICTPSFDVARQINEGLGKGGNLRVDGRPTLSLTAPETVEVVMGASKENFIYPAHCLPPETEIHANGGIKKIKDVKKGDVVYTHKCRWRKVKRIYKRGYKGKIFHIKPFYFREGLRATDEHPFYAIKTSKNCAWTNGFCKPKCSAANSCKRRYFKDYKPEWIRAEELEKNDVLIFPRFDEVKDVNEIKISTVIPDLCIRKDDKVIPLRGTRVTGISNNVLVDRDFCRLLGYYISEGYTNSRDCVSFCFNSHEKRYQEDVKELMRKVFGISKNSVGMKEGRNGVELIFYSKILASLFNKLFYGKEQQRRANTKQMPQWTLYLPLEKQVEIIRGWWRGDTGYTSSRCLMNQMKVIFLRLGIIPSILVDRKEAYMARGRHTLGGRIIKANYDAYQFSNLSFFEDRFNLLAEEEFSKYNTKLKRRHGWIDDNYVYVPIRDIFVEEYEGEVYNLEVADDNSYATEFATVHNCWTPWFGVFGSKSGFDSLEECYGDMLKYVHAIETGLSSDPEMNWRLSALDRCAIISSSDAHSPQKLGREANVFDLEEISYGKIMDAIKKKDKSSFLLTYEFFPQEGKYHADGHRNCGILYEPDESKRHNNICPVCRRPLTVGVLHRVDDLADRKLGEKPKNAIPFEHIIPLQEIIAKCIGKGVGTKEVISEYFRVVKYFGNEFNALHAKEDQLLLATGKGIAKGIANAQAGRVKITPGYDGVYGEIEIEGVEEGEKIGKKKESQKTLGDF